MPGEAGLSMLPMAIPADPPGPRGLAMLHPEVAVALRRRGPGLAAAIFKAAILRANWTLRHTSATNTPTNKPMQATKTIATSQVRARWLRLPTAVTPLWNAIPVSSVP